MGITTSRGNTATALQYDNSGRLVEYRDAAGAQRKYEHDATGLRSVTGPEGDTLRYEYDRAGRIAALRYDDKGRASTKKYKYDDAGRVTETTNEDGTVEQFQYDATGRLLTKRDRFGSTYKYQYADNGRFAAIEGPFGTERWKYDSQGRMVEHADPAEGVFRFEYADKEDQVTVIDPGGSRMRVTTNAAGQPLLVEDAAGGRIHTSMTKTAGWRKRARRATGSSSATTTRSAVSPS
jgi:YD repeat-containing protein